MSTPLSKVMVPPVVAVPRGALWAAACVQGLGASLWRGLQAAGQSRASRELLMLARFRVHHDPVLARQLRVAGEAAAVRALAFRMMKSDPRQAADLLAAAERHEGLDSTADQPCA